MNHIKEKLCRLALAVLASSALASPVMADPVVSISPASQNIAVGATTTIDIVVSDLSVPIGGFSLLLKFNTSILQGLSFVNDPGGVMEIDPLFDYSNGFDNGTLDLFVLPAVGATGDGQPADFTLATVEFKGLKDGLGELLLQGVNLSYFDGNTTIPQTSDDGQICVGDCSNVPEPASMVLVGTALGALALLRRRRSAAPAS